MLSIKNKRPASIYSVIVLFNPDIPILARLVDSILNQVSHVLLVDNGSTNFLEVKAQIPESDKVSHVALGDNYGIAKAHNVGIQTSRASGASHVLIFDQDSYAPANLVEELLKAEATLLERGEKVAAVGPSFFDPRTNNPYPFSKIDGFKLRSIYPSPENPVIEASFLISSGSLIRTEALEAVGLMREEFFIDYVDIEWCLRARSLGFKSFGVPGVSMEHSVGDNRLRVLGREISIHSPLRRYYLSRNGLLIIKLPYIPWKYKIRELSYSVSRVAVFLLFVPNKLRYLKYISLGWAHGLLGKGGKFGA